MCKVGITYMGFEEYHGFVGSCNKGRNARCTFLISWTWHHPYLNVSTGKGTIPYHKVRMHWSRRGDHEQMHITFDEKGWAEAREQPKLLELVVKYVNRMSSSQISTKVFLFIYLSRWTISRVEASIAKKLYEKMSFSPFFAPRRPPRPHFQNASQLTEHFYSCT